MAQKKEIKISARKRLMVLILLPSLYFTYLSSKSIYHDVTGGSFFSFNILFDFSFSAIAFIVFGSIMVNAIKRWFDKGPGLILNSEGIIDRSGLVFAGTVLWEDIEGISNTKIVFSDCINVKVKNPQKYINRQGNLFNRTWLQLENNRYGSPVNISVNGLRIKFKALFSIVQQQYLSSQVETRTLDLKREKDEILQEKTELLDSINYAKRIQTALLPSHSLIEKKLGESFILFLPKDIVSGDFYWAETVNEWMFFAVCDCTGHGVPGALISIVCNNALNRTVKEYGIIQPSEILDKVAELIVESIGVDGEVKDGMDATVCAFNKSTRDLFWSGANLPLWIARESEFYELLEFKPDKQPIGQVDNRLVYTNHKIEIQKGDILYMFSDGYADQFGGEHGKKLTRKKFKEILMEQRGVSLKEQYINLLEFHSSYRKGFDQIDDILVMGIRIEH